MAGFNLQNAVDQAIIKVSGAAAAGKSIKQQKQALKEQEDSTRRELTLQELSSGLEFDKADSDLYLNELETANEMRKESDKPLVDLETEDINKYFNNKNNEYYHKYTQAVSDRDKAMGDPRYKDKRTKAGRKFSKAEKDMEMYFKARAEITEKMNLHNELFRNKKFYKEKLDKLHKEMDNKNIPYDRTEAEKYDVHNTVTPI